MRDGGLTLPRCRVQKQRVCSGADPRTIDTIALELPPGQSPRKGQLKVKSLESLRGFVNLLHLNLSGHGLLSMDGLEALPRFVTLILARNSLKVIKLSKLMHLR
ncbi:hypothetical protein ACHHYP_00499 [Achlya hypogyna]|uniref:Uncharacterized protein n=1 Tax=Achlya hypogyna TaxID=1202772 RepID=A0A1V9ZAY4_ACHHY|nr:hypothetical protein ACHHYP_00499 [Achlya hypogyna]